MSIEVLVAEDELLIALDVIDELDAAGFVAIGPFANASRALDYIRVHTPDCAVLDLRLADGESLPIADVLAERNVPLIFHSGHGSREALEQRYPGARVCAKPSGPTALVKIIAELCPQGSA